MELHQVRYFLALADCLNFTRAAEQCNVTQPALTKAIQKLELEFGGALIHRERPLTRLTDLGNLVRPMLERTLAAADAARTNAREFKRKKIAPLRVALTPSVSARLVMGPLNQIAARMSGLQIELIEVRPDDVMDCLLGGDVNAAIRGNYGVIPERINRWPLFEERIMVMASQLHRLSAYSEISKEELGELTWLAPADCEVTHQFFRDHFPAHTKPKIGHVSNQSEHLQHMAVAGLGSMLMPEHMPRLEGTVLLPVKGVGVWRQVELLVVAGRHYSPALEAFIKATRSYNWDEELDAASSAHGQVSCRYPDFSGATSQTLAAVA